MSIAVVDLPSVTDAFRRNAESRPGEPAVTFVRDLSAGKVDETLTYAELDVAAREIAVRLGGRLAPGDRALLLYPEGIHFAAAFLGCLYAGVVAVPAPLPGQYRHQRERVTAIARNAGVGIVLTNSIAHADVREWAAAEESVTADIVVTDLRTGGAIDGATDEEAYEEAYEGAAAVDPDAWVAPPLGHDTLALLQYTSGSTGEPKGVMITHGNLLHNVDSLRRTFGLDASTHFGSWIPHYHDMGLMGVLLPPLVLGGSCTLMAPTTFLKRPHWWLRMIDAYDLDWSPGPNFAYELCARQITDEQLDGVDLSRWKYAPNGSEPVQASTLATFAERFAAAGFRAGALTPCYGMAEATVFISGAGTREPVIRQVDAEALARHEFVPTVAWPHSRAVVSCGAAHDYTVRVVDPHTREVLPQGRIGEIWLRGDSVAQGYWERPEATQDTFRAETADGQGGFLRTGDLGLVHEGEIHVTGRIKETLIVRGRNLYPQDIEHELRAQHDDLKGLFGAVFTVSVPGPDRTDERIVVTHEVRGRLSADVLAKLTAGIRQTVAREFGTGVHTVALLRRGGVRRTTSGKIQRATMRELFLAGDLKPLHLDADTDRARGRASARRQA
ncbi:fatty acyl-AMP ligase [Streptomyces sp. NPDC048275]|uniref:fatty acyl-AMP ligase n=1 Tax=Streptomyces sp. NPDC048275 TaxID=3155629 RepID=UPI0033DEB55D